MLARLGDLDLDGAHPLAALRARTGDDASIALLDAWAVVADVLTFYQERIANEGYLRTATERRSLVELARLVGYRLRPGVAADAHLAYLLDIVPGTETVAGIPKGSRAQSVPGPGELPQAFETGDDLAARASWNTLRPRPTRPTLLTAGVSALYVAGIATGVKPNDRLLVNRDPDKPAVRIVATVTAQPVDDRTVLELQPVPAVAPVMAPRAKVVGDNQSARVLESLLPALRRPVRLPPAATGLDRDPAVLFAAGSDLRAQLLTVAEPSLAGVLYPAWAAASVVEPPPDPVRVQRIRAVPYGATAPRKPILNENGAAIDTEEWPLESTIAIRATVALRGSTPTSVVVEMSRAGQRATATVAIPGDRTVDFPGLGTAHVVEPANPDGVGTGVVTITYGGTVNRVVTIGEASPINLAAAPQVAIGNGPVPVVLDRSDLIWRPDNGETLHRRLEGRSVTVALGQRPRAITVADEQPVASTRRNVLPLNAVYERIVPGTWAVIERAGAPNPLVTVIDGVDVVSRNSYNFPATVTQLTLRDDWLTSDDTLLSAIREITVYAQSEHLDLVPEPWTDDIEGDSIPLDALYSGLTPGRLIIVAGDRTDIPGAAGVPGAEVAMIAGVVQGVDAGRPGDTVHTTLRLAADLAFTYRRPSVRVWGNVVGASHGESTAEVLGSGDATRPGQSFTLHRSPLTYIASDTPGGAESTLEVRVDGVRWHEQDDLFPLGPTDHAYLTRTDDRGATTVVFGDGVHGARPPTGPENLAAAYRIGIGAAGNVRPGQIMQLLTRPLGVNAVTNPLRASGGADGDSLSQARTNIPIGVLALDRLVSVSDYADFTRARAGIGKTIAARLSDGARTVVHLTIAGVGDIPIDPTSALYTGLRRALAEFGDPGQPVVVAVRDLALIVVAAGVEVDPDHRFDLVEPVIRAALLDRFGFERRDFGQDVVLSEVIATIQGVPGVVGTTVTTLAVVPPDPTSAVLSSLIGSAPAARIPVDVAHHDKVLDLLLPAQLALLSPAVPDTLILKER
jgi:predicted phage baseplate assembly protein